MNIEDLKKAYEVLDDTKKYWDLREKFLKENNISEAFWRAYSDSQCKGLELIDFENIVQGEEFSDIVENLKRFKIKEFTMSVNSTDVIERIKIFVDLGCEIIGIVSIKKPYQSGIEKSFLKKTSDFKPAIKFKVC